MTLSLILKGMLLGMINAAPIGPVGLLCLQKNMAPDRRPGLFAGMGMAFAYGIISFCVVFGLRAISHFLQEHESFFQAVSGLLLILMGGRGLHPNSGGRLSSPVGRVRLLGEFSASFMMTTFNPVPFASFVVLLASFQIFKVPPGVGVDLIFAASVMSGTLVFWLLVNEVLHHVKKRTPEILSRRLGIGTSIVLLVCGVMIAAKGIF